MNLLNSQFTQYALRFGLSKGGIGVRWVVGLAIGALTQKAFLPEGDLKEIQTGLESGGMALLAILYGFVEWWLQHRQKDGVRVIQTMAQMTPGAPNPKIDGIAANSTINAVAAATGVPAGAAIASVKS